MVLAAVEDVEALAEVAVAPARAARAASSAARRDTARSSALRVAAAVAVEDAEVLAVDAVALLEAAAASASPSRTRALASSETSVYTIQTPRRASMHHRRCPIIDPLAHFAFSLLVSSCLFLCSVLPLLPLNIF